MKRVWCLYRVSTQSQVGRDDDLPVQKNACHRFMDTMPNWKLTRELYEKGVSGWKNRIEERVELQKIKKGAINKKFDVLLVYMIDRLGRTDELSIFINSLIKQGVEVWSTVEGQIKMDTEVDRLLGFLHGWQAQNESKKISERSREAKKQLSERGFFQGGPVPIGYKAVETSQMHPKIMDKYASGLAVDENEAEIVKLIFSLYVDKHMGYRKIVDYLNSKGYRNRDGKVLGVSTVQRILINPIYVGKKRYRSFEGNESDTQPYNEGMRIVSDEVFKQAETIRNTRKEKLREQDKTGIPLSGKLLFSGLAHCAYCGSKLSGNYLYRKQKRKNDGEDYVHVVYRYRCPLNKGKLNFEHDSSIWGAKKYDAIIMKRINEILSHINMNLKPFIESAKQQKQSMLKQKEQNMQKMEKQLSELSRGLQRLHGEIVKALSGSSVFTTEQLSEAIESEKIKIEEQTAILNALKDEIECERGNYSDVDYMTDELMTWEQKFNSADDYLKKAMLSRIVDKVYLGKESVDLELNIMLEEFLLQHEEEMSD